jgi:hypothetical protein
MLRLMLAQTPELHIPAESGFLPELARRQRRYGTFTSSAQRAHFIRDLQASHATSLTRSFDVFEMSEDEMDAVLKSAAPIRYPSAAALLFGEVARKHGKNRWGDKTPRHVLHIRWLAQTFPDATFIHIIRDPRAVVASLRRAGWHRIPRRAARFWRHRVRAGRAAGHTIDPYRYMEIRYEDLVSHPDQSLKRLCDFCGLTFVSDMLQFYEAATDAVPAVHEHLFEHLKAPVNPARAESWRTELTPRDISEIEAVARRAMVDLGYSLEETPPPILRLYVLTVIDTVHRILWGLRRAIVRTRY